MATHAANAREVFTEAVRAVLETWPVLQIAVDNGFGGPHSQQKAEWMVDVVQQYFHDNADLQQYEVEDFLSDLMNNEFDTMVDDGSLPQVAEKVCLLFRQCQRGKLDEVRGQIGQMAQSKSSGRAKATQVETPADDEEGREEDGLESMECDGASEGTSVGTAPRQQAAASAEPPDEDGWMVVRRKK